MLKRTKINASVSPKGSLETLSQREVQQLRETGSGSVYRLFRQCALAILNTGSHSDNVYANGRRGRSIGRDRN